MGQALDVTGGFVGETMTQAISPSVSDDSGEHPNPYNPPGVETADDSTRPRILGELIPYRNRPALVGYYLGIFSLLALVPLLGILFLVLALGGIWYGYRGLVAARRDQQVSGEIHAWIGLGTGMLAIFLGLPLQTISVLSTLNLIDQVNENLTTPVLTILPWLVIPG